MTRPTDDMNPTDLAAGYVLDDLSSEEAVRLRQALAEDPALSEEIESFEEAFSLLPYGLPSTEPSARLKDKILSAASRPVADTVSEPQRLTALPSNDLPISSPRQRNWGRWMPAISTGIAAIAVAALCLNQVQLGRQSQQTAALQQQLDATNSELKNLRSNLQANRETIALLSDPNTQVQSLIGTVPNSTDSSLATARLLAKSGDREVTLVAQDLPQLPADQIYRLWSVADTSTAPKYCGEFRQDDSGIAQWVVPDVVCTQQPLQTIITLDAPGDPITSAGPLVMRSTS